MVPLLVVLAALILSLEILQFLLAARLLATLAMAVAWVRFLSRGLQVQSILAALLYHGVVEGYVEWKATFPSVMSTRKDRRVILWLLFWLRVFIWSATVSATQGVQQFQSRQEEQDYDSRWRIVVLTFAYCEVLEVLLLLYFADHAIPYRWKQRFLHWLASICIGLLEARGTLAHVTGLVLGHMPFGVLVILLLVLMYATIRIPWYRVVETLLRHEEASSNDEKPAMPEDDDEERLGRMHNTNGLYSPVQNEQYSYQSHQSYQDHDDDDIYLTKPSSSAMPVFVPSGFSSESEDELVYR